MTGYEAYCHYVSLKRHFNEWKFDYERYGPARVKPETYEKRPDAFRFTKLARQQTPIWTMTAVLARNGSAWIGDMVGDEAAEVRDQARGRVEALAYQVKRELADYKIGDLLRTVPGSHPLLARKVMAGRISWEVGSALFSSAGAVESWRTSYEEDPVLGPMTIRLARYFPLMPVDKKSVKEALLQTFSA